MKNTRLYELIYVVAPTATEQEVTDLHEQVEATAGRFAATLVKTENWGRRKLAYEIAGHKEATYVLELIEGTGELIKELERRLKVSELVLRYLSVRVDEELRAAERVRGRRQADVDRRAARTGAPVTAMAADPGAAAPGDLPEVVEPEPAAAGPDEGGGAPEKAEA